MISALAFVAVVTSSLVVSQSQNDDGESCVPVAHELAPCVEFIGGSDGGFGGENRPAACCNGAKKVVGDAKTKKDKVDLCECIKKTLAMIGAYDPNRIPLISKGCELSVQFYPIDDSTDCSKYFSILNKTVRIKWWDKYLYPHAEIKKVHEWLKNNNSLVKPSIRLTSTFLTTKACILAAINKATSQAEIQNLLRQLQYAHSDSSSTKSCEEDQEAPGTEAERTDNVDHIQFAQDPDDEEFHLDSP